MNALERAGMALAGSKLGGIVYHRLCRPIDTLLIPLTKGRLSLGPSDTLLLTTTGARSGKPRKAALAFLRKGDDLVVIASKGGAPHHPAWYHNLRAHPRATVETRDGVEERVAREAEDAERDALFAEAAARYPTYAAYGRRASTRRIPVIVLSPATTPGTNRS